MSSPATNDPRLADICTRFGVQRLRMFGSSATQTASAGSDIDLIVEFIPGKAPGAFALVDLQDELSELFGGRPVDLAFPSILHNPYRRRIIEPQLRPLFG